MSKRRISISYDFRPDEPSGGQELEIRIAFAALGWTVTSYGGGSSNVHRCYLSLESEGPRLRRATLLATLAQLGIPVDDDLSIHGDVTRGH